jgi:rubredoxin
MIMNRVKDDRTEYKCVLCGSVFDSSEYRWGAREEKEIGAGGCNDWSCPVCGGVVVEYARVPMKTYESDAAVPR